MGSRTDCFIINETRTTNLNHKHKCYLFLPTETTQTVNFYSGDYLIELWGANGYSEYNDIIGKGGYTSGVIKFRKKTTAYFVIGTQGGYDRSLRDYYGGFNGGIYGSGGATDLRLVSSTYESRILVAGGGGSSSWKFYDSAGYGSAKGGNAGGLKGEDGYGYEFMVGGKGATQTSGYSFGKGGGVGYGYNLVGGPADFNPGSGGGGYYGGFGGKCDKDYGDPLCGGGGGGSSYASQHFFNHTKLLSGNESIPIISANIKYMNQQMIGNVGDGAARVTILKLRTLQPKINYHKSYKLLFIFGYK